MTKTFKPFFSPPAAAAGDEPEGVVVLDELHAASTADAARSTAETHSTRFRDRLIMNPFNPNGRTQLGWVSRKRADPAGEMRRAWGGGRRVGVIHDLPLSRMARGAPGPGTTRATGPRWIRR